MTGGLNDSKVASRTHAMMSVDRPRSWRRGACHVLGIAGAGNCALTQLRGLNPPRTTARYSRYRAACAKGLGRREAGLIPNSHPDVRHNAVHVQPPRLFLEWDALLRKSLTACNFLHQHLQSFSTPSLLACHPFSLQLPEISLKVEMK